MRKPKPPYKTHENLVDEILLLKVSHSALRLNMLMESIKDMEHQIKVLSERHNKDVETMRTFATELAGEVDSLKDVNSVMENVVLSHITENIEEIADAMAGEQG